MTHHYPCACLKEIQLEIIYSVFESQASPQALDAPQTNVPESPEQMKLQGLKSRI